MLRTAASRWVGLISLVGGFVSAAGCDFSDPLASDKWAFYSDEAPLLPAHDAAVRTPHAAEEAPDASAAGADAHAASDASHDASADAHDASSDGGDAGDAAESDAAH